MPEYLPPPTAACPTFVDDSEWHPLIDGATYFTELARTLTGLGAGDAVLIAGLSIDPDVDLDGRMPGEPDYVPLGDRLAALADNSVLVRVLLAGRVLASSLPLAGLGDFRDNAERARRLRGWQPSEPRRSATAPLSTSVLVDFSGSALGSNHAKAVAVLRRGVLTAFVGGIDLENDRYDAQPHHRMRLKGERWGWHDIAVRLRGPAAEQVWRTLAARWTEASTLPRQRYLRSPRHLVLINPEAAAPSPGDPPAQEPVPNPGTAVQVLRSLSRHKYVSPVPGRTRSWETFPPTGLQEVFVTVSCAIAAARRYVYIEDQYLGEELGGHADFELYPVLREAAARGVKVILVGSGIRDPDDPGLHLRPINRSLNRDLRTKIADRLDATRRRHFAVWRVEHATVHAKLVLVDDAFACIGSANMFSRSMGGVDNELSAAVQTSGTAVRDLRVRVWAEHLRTPLTEPVRTALDDLDLALGMWDEQWLPPQRSLQTWQVAGQPAGFAPAERVLARVDTASARQ